MRESDFAPEPGEKIANVRSRGGVGGLIVTVIVLAVGAVAGFMAGAVNGGRVAQNSANAAARVLKTEVGTMKGRLEKIDAALVASQTRLRKARQGVVSFDPALTKALAAIDLGPKPAVNRMLKADYYRLPDTLVDPLMQYYYESSALYRDLEMHVKRSKADEQAITSYLKQQAEDVPKKGAYGVVLSRAGDIAVSSLVEIGSQVCGAPTKQGCPLDKLEGYKVRGATSGAWVPRPIGPKITPKNVFPIKPSELLQTALTGAPNQVRVAAYQQRLGQILRLVTGLKQKEKLVVEALNKAAAEKDLLAWQ